MSSVHKHLCLKYTYPASTGAVCINLLYIAHNIGAPGIVRLVSTMINNHIIIQNILKEKNTKYKRLSGIGPVLWSLCTFKRSVGS